MHDAFKALGDPHRLEIVRLALAAPRHVRALADALHISQPAVSRHIAILERAGLVVLSRKGRRTEVHAPPPDPAPEIATLLELVGRGRASRGRTADAHPRTVPVTRHPAREELDDYLL